MKISILYGIEVSVFGETNKKKFRTVNKTEENCKKFHGISFSFLNWIPPIKFRGILYEKCERNSVETDKFLCRQYLWPFSLLFKKRKTETKWNSVNRILFSVSAGNGNGKNTEFRGNTETEFRFPFPSLYFRRKQNWKKYGILRKYGNGNSVETLILILSDILLNNINFWKAIN